jgi:hypothetical protein
VNDVPDHEDRLHAPDPSVEEYAEYLEYCGDLDYGDEEAELARGCAEVILEENVKQRLDRADELPYDRRCSRKDAYPHGPGKLGLG